MKRESETLKLQFIFSMFVFFPLRWRKVLHYQQSYFVCFLRLRPTHIVRTNGGHKRVFVHWRFFKLVVWLPRRIYKGQTKSLRGWHGCDLPKSCGDFWFDHYTAWSVQNLNLWEHTILGDGDLPNSQVYCGNFNLTSEFVMVFPRWTSIELVCITLVYINHHKSISMTLFELETCHASPF